MRVFFRSLAAFLLITLNLNAQNAGNLDQTFGTNGKSEFAGAPYAIEPLPDGHFLVQARTDADQWLLLKYQPDGLPDSTYGINGVFQTNISATSRLEILNQDSFWLWQSVSVGMPDFNNEIQINKLNASLEKDVTWGNQGLVTLHPGRNNYLFFMKSLPDGKVLALGMTRVVEANYYDSNMFVARLTADGQLDPDFGNQGIVKLNVPNGFDYTWQLPVGLIVRPDGKIVIGADINRPPANGNHALFYFTQLLPNGSTDSNFGNFGTITQAIGTQNTRLDEFALDANGRLIGAGVADQSLTVLARYLPNGTLDNTFSGDGLFTTNYMRMDKLLIQPDNKIVLAGNEYNVAMDQSLFIRLSENGAFDNTFSGDGKANSIFRRLIPNK